MSAARGTCEALRDVEISFNTLRAPSPATEGAETGPRRIRNWTKLRAVVFVSDLRQLHHEVEFRQFRLLRLLMSFRLLLLLPLLLMTLCSTYLLHSLEESDSFRQARVTPAPARKFIK